MLGSNLGKREEWLAYALQELTARAGVPGVTSKYYETEPWGYTGSGRFLNQAVQLVTSLSPLQLLECIHAIEQSAGRERTGSQYTDRSLDIDILFFGNQILDSTDLIIPHPRLHLRRFCLVPLVEIIPDWIHPVLRKTMRELLIECPDELMVHPVKP